MYINALLQGRLTGPSGSPVAFETIFGWVLGGNISCLSPSFHVTSHCTSISSRDDTICKFWEIEEAPPTCNDSELSLEERTIVRHFQETHSRSPEGRFIISLPKKPGVSPLGESRSQAVRRFLSLERSLHGRGLFQEVNEIMLEYLSLGHAENVPLTDAYKPQSTVYYLPMHVVYKSSSSTTKIRAVFDASAKSSTGISLNDTLLVGPTVHR